MIDYGMLFAASLIFSVISFSTAVAFLLTRNAVAWRPSHGGFMAILALNCVAGLATWQLLHPRWELLVPLSFGLFLPCVASRLLKDFTVAGRLLIVTLLQASFFGLGWGFCILVTASVSPVTRTLMFVSYPLVALCVLVGFVQSFEQWEVICRRTWRHPRAPLSPVPRSRYPKVSLHVAAYAEPPDLVIATLDALAELQYPNFEVLVIDNNTADPALWRPVEAHCQCLGERFRFFHVDRLEGAKAGALNFALHHTAADAELIGVVDSDYKVDRNFLAALIGYFDDPNMGFVQTPQAYREWEPHSYLRMCNWEYKLVFASTLVSRNERMAAITVGTMGLIRRSVLEEVGGWAEWCVTEDSELAVRIHAHGYRSVYLNTVFGRGLIPESFSDYKKQRFRWTYGPIQELRRHFRLFLPRPLGQTSALTRAQKIHHLSHGLGALKSGLEFLMIPLGAIVMASMILHDESIAVPQPLWLILGGGAIAGLALKWHLYRTTMRCSLKDMVGALMATMALAHIIRMASLWGLFTRNTPWRRTNKFRALPLGLGALSSALWEAMLGGSLWAASLVVLAAYHPAGLLRVFLLGGLVQGTQYLAAPLLAILAERGIQSRAGVLTPDLSDSQVAVETTV